jgi:membrane-bound ClpP family serine protease
MIRATFIRVSGFVISSSIAWVFYLAWIAVEIAAPGRSHDRLIAALILCILGGFSAALALLPLPWAGIVWIFSKIRVPGVAYFTIAGTVLMVLIGCATASISPKPLFIEDQTFFEGVLIALQRQGLCLAFAGAICGLGYWLLAERNVRKSSRIRSRSSGLGTIPE